MAKRSLIRNRRKNWAKHHQSRKRTKNVMVGMCRDKKRRKRNNRSRVGTVTEREKMTRHTEKKVAKRS